MISELALFWNGAICSTYGYLFLANPSLLIDNYYSMSIEVTPVLQSICCYYGATLLTLAFLFLHYIPFKEKQGPGLRLGMMLSMAYMCVAGYRVVMEKDTATAGALAAANKTMILQGVTLAVSFFGFKAAPKPDKKKKK